MDMNPKAYKTLEDVWAAVPRIECRKRCAGSCTVVPLHQIELQRLVKDTGPVAHLEFGIARETRVLRTVDGACPKLRFKQCTAYVARPLICRLYGVAEEMPCQHGCKPERTLDRDEVAVLIEAIHRIGGLQG